MLKIAIATKSRYKINAILMVLHQLDIEFDTKTYASDSEVSEQPKEIGETKQGSINRARNALEQDKDVDLAIGVEFGYEPVDGVYKMHCWCTVITQEGGQYSEQSSTLELPKVLAEKLLDDKDVSENLPLVSEKLENIERNRIFDRYLRKRIFIEECVRASMLRFLLRDSLY